MANQSRDPLMELTFDLMCVLSADGRFHGVNKNFRETLGFTPQDVSKASFLHILHRDDVTSTVGALQLLKSGSKTVEFDARIRGHQGYIWMRWRCHVRDPKEGKIYTVAQNIDQAKRLEIELYQLQNFDERTGLLNRDKLFEQLDQLTDDSRSGLIPFSLVMIGLEEVQSVNETFGHHVGDLLLKSFASRLQDAAASGMPVARFAGDQFAIVIPSIDYDVVDSKVDALLRAITEPYSLDGLRCTIGASMGLETVTHAKHSAALLIRNADKALDIARKNSSEKYCWYPQVASGASEAAQPDALRQSA